MRTEGEAHESYPWIATFTARLALNWRRSRGRLLFQDPDSSPLDLPGQDLLSESILEQGANDLWMTVNSLSQGERTAVLLFYKQDMGVADVAKVLGVTPGSVKTLLFRAREVAQGDRRSRSARFTSRKVAK